MNSQSSEFDKEGDPKPSKYSSKSLLKSLTSTNKSSKWDPTHVKCLCDKPATIETRHSMKLLPSIPEMSENSSSKRDKPKKIVFGEPPSTSSREDVVDTRKSMSSKIRVCVPRGKDIDMTVCPHYEDKATSVSRSVHYHLEGVRFVVLH